MCVLSKRFTATLEATMETPLPSVHCTRLFDMRPVANKIRHPPTLHIARGYEAHLPFLCSGRVVICIADWQVEPATQRHFWEQAMAMLTDECGAAAVARALVLVAGDMASSSNDLRGSDSDAAPDLSWLRECFPEGDVLCVYGNHDLAADEHLGWRNATSDLPCLLPHGAAVHVEMTLEAAAARGSLPVPLAAAPPRSTEQQPASVEANAGAQPMGPGVRGRKKHTVPSKNTRPMRPPGSASPHEIQSPYEMSLPVPERLVALYEGHPALRLPLGAATRQPSTAPTAAATARAKAAAAAAAASSAASSAAATSAVLVRPREASSLIIGAVHGVPAQQTQGLRKIEREAYFRAVRAACSVPDLDVLVTHSNPKLAGQAEVRGEDAKRLHEAFLQSSARLHVHGHMHTDPVVSIVGAGKVVVNADCRVVVFLPPEVHGGEAAASETGHEAAAV